MNIQEKIVEAASKLEQVYQLSKLGQTHEWQAMRKSLLAVIQARTKRLCEDDCGEPETRTIRAELRSFGWFLRAADVSEATLAELRKNLEGLQAALAKRHDYGLTDGIPEDGKSHEAIQMLLHRTRNL